MAECNIDIIKKLQFFFLIVNIEIIFNVFIKIGNRKFR